MSNSDKSVIIVGGGLSGLAAARAFQLRNIKVTVFERDPNSDSRKGYALSIKPDTLAGFKDVLKLDTRVITESSVKPEVFTFYNHFNSKLISFKGDALGIQSTRVIIKKMLLDSLLPNTVIYSKSFEKFIEDESTGKVTVYFEDGTSYQCDMLIAADGSKSRVRKQLIGDKRNFYNVIRICEPRIKNLDLPKEMIMSHSKSAVLQVSYKDEGTIYGVWACYLNEISEEKLEQLIANPQQAKDLVIEKTKNWKHPVINLIEKSDPSTFWITGIYDYNIEEIEKIESTSVVLIGDAAHAMTPFRGQGGNMAILDGIACLELDFTRESKRQFYQKMVQRVKPWVIQSRRGIGQLLEGGYGRDMLLRMIDVVLNKKFSLLAIVGSITALTTAVIWKYFKK